MEIRQSIQEYNKYVAQVTLKKSADYCMCTGFWTVYHVCIRCPQRPIGVRFTRTRGTNRRMLSCGCWESIPGPLERQKRSQLLSRLSSPKAWTNFIENNYPWGWRDGSRVKSTSSSSRGPQFSSLLPCQVALTSVC